MKKNLPEFKSLLFRKSRFAFFIVVATSSLIDDLLNSAQFVFKVILLEEFGKEASS